jgi:hypothetical protein
MGFLGSLCGQDRSENVGQSVLVIVSSSRTLAALPAETYLCLLDSSAAHGARFRFCFSTPRQDLGQYAESQKEGQRLN